MSNTILRVKNLKQYFNTSQKQSIKAVDGISFEIKEGEVHGLVGESGCGKTTTGRSIIKIYQITGGEVEFDGKIISVGIEEHLLNIKNKKNEIKRKIKKLVSVTEIKKLKIELSNYIQQEKNIIKDKRENDVKVSKDFMKSIQMIFQDPIESLNPRMTVGEIIAEGLKINGEKDKVKLKTLIDESLEKVGLLPEHASRYPHEFSGGQRQRIGIARALILKPKLIIADEPISALDVSIQAQVINLLQELKDEYNLTILFIAHDLSVVKYFCDNITVMYFGKIVESGPGDKLFANPMHPYTKSLLSAIPIPDPNYQKTRVRVKYDNTMHDYSVEKPTLKELSEGHYVLANSKEYDEYKKNYK